MYRYAIFDQDRVLRSFLTVSDQNEIAKNVPPGYGSIRSETQAEPGTVRFDLAGKIVSLDNSIIETPAQAQARMLDRIDEEREERMMAVLTTGGAKKYEYANKAREVRDYRTLPGATIALLLTAANLAGTQERFAWAMAEAADTGDSLETVIARYEAAMRRTAIDRKVAARAQKLKRAIVAAKDASGNPNTTAQKAIFDARTWPTS